MVPSNTCLEFCVADRSTETGEVCIGREWKGGLIETETFF